MLLSQFVQKWYLDKGTGGSHGRVLVCDSDHDSQIELIFGYGEDLQERIELYELYPDNIFHLETAIDTMSSEAWAVGDFDDDGLYDVIIQGDFGLPTVGIQIYESPDSFSYPIQEVWRDTVGFAVVQPISAYDVDNDGYPEILDNNGNGQPHFFWIYEAIGNNQYDTVYATNPDTTLLDGPVSTHAFGDFDNDGKMEFAMGGMSAGALGATYWVYESPANNTYEQIIQGYVNTKNIRDCFSVSDADGDGKMEFVVKGYWVSGTIDAFIFEAIADNTYEIVKTFSFPGGDYYGGYSEAGDVDGDAIPEIVLESRQNIFIIKGAGNDSFYVWETLPGHASGSCVRIFDIDNNGLSEIIISGDNETRIYEYDPGGIEETTPRFTPNAQCLLHVFPNPFKEKLNIRYQTTDNNNVNLKIYDVSGRLVRSFNHLANSPISQITWDSKDENGRAVAQGVYFVGVEYLDTKEILVHKVLKILSRQ